MLDHDLIQISKGSPFNSPCHLLPKKTGKPRIITNFMYVNKLIEQNRWPIPSVRNVLEHLSGSQYFSVMDCKKGFWQIKITENSRSLTAFSCRGRLYEYKRLPQGMSISPGAFKLGMSLLFGIQDIHKTLGSMPWCLGHKSWVIFPRTYTLVYDAKPARTLKFSM